MDKYVGVYENNTEENVTLTIWGENELCKNIKILEFYNKEELLANEDNEWSLRTYELELPDGKCKYQSFRTDEDMDKLRSTNNYIERRINELKVKLQDKQLTEDDLLKEKLLINKRIANLEKTLVNLFKARDIQSKRMMDNDEYYTLSETLEEGN